MASGRAATCGEGATLGAPLSPCVHVSGSSGRLRGASRVARGSHCHRPGRRAARRRSEVAVSRWLLRAMLVASLALGGCSTAAQFLMADGEEVSGTIVGGDVETVELVVQVEQDDRGVTEARRRLTRSEIVRMQHPGERAFYAGLGLIGVATALTALGVAGTIAVESSEDSDPQDALVGVPLIFGAIGLAIHIPQTICSHRTWKTSVEAFEPPADAVSVQLAPSGLLVRF